MFLFEFVSPEVLKKSKTRLYTIGALLVAIGILALVLAPWSSLSIELLIGGLLLVSGIAFIVDVIMGDKNGEKPWQELFIAILSILAGLFLLAYPGAGMVTLTMFITFFFIVEGVARILDYARLRQLKGSIWILIGGIVEIIFAIFLWSDILSSTIIIGILFGVNMIMAGAVRIYVAYNLDKPVTTDIQP